MTNRETAEMIAQFRTPPGFSRQDLADDIETALDAKAAELEKMVIEAWHIEERRLKASNEPKFITLTENRNIAHP